MKRCQASDQGDALLVLGEIDPVAHGYLADHAIGESIVLPAAGLVEALLEACSLVLGPRPLVIRELKLEQPLLLQAGQRRLLYVELRREEEQYRAAVRSAPAPDGDGAALRVQDLPCFAVATVDLGADPTVPVEHAWRALPEPVGVEDHYRACRSSGLRYGPHFQRIIELTRAGSEQVAAKVKQHEDVLEASGYLIHPAVLDACFQATRVLQPQPGRSGVLAGLPIGADRITFLRPVRGEVSCEIAQRPSEDPEMQLFDVAVWDGSGQVCLHLGGLRRRSVPRELLEQRLAVGPQPERGSVPPRPVAPGPAAPGPAGLASRFALPKSSYYLLDWVESSAPPPPPTEPGPQLEGRWLLLVRDGSWLVELASQEIWAGGKPQVQTRESLATGPEATDRHGLAALLDEACRSGPLAGIVYGWGLDGPLDGRGHAPGSSAHAGGGPTDPAAESRCVVERGWELLCLLQALAAAPPPLPVLQLVTEGAHAVSGFPCRPEQAALLGIKRAAAALPDGPVVRVCDLDPELPAGEKCADLLNELLHLCDPQEDEVVWRGSTRLLPRLCSEDALIAAGAVLPPPASSWRLDVVPKGSLQNLGFVEQARPGELGPRQVEVRVQAAGLSFCDVRAALDLGPGDAGRLGRDGAGVVERVGAAVRSLSPGDRVFGHLRGSLADRAVADERVLSRIPKEMSFLEAASLPGIFVIAFESLVRLADASDGERVLIHAAAGGVGLAAVQLALDRGCEVHATAGSERKRDHLRRLGIRHVYSSRSTEFSRQVREATGGRGVDVVLDSLSGPGFVEASLDCLAPHGRFVELGQREIWTPEQVQARRPDVHYFTLALDELVAERPDSLAELHLALLPLFDRKRLHPVRAEVFGLHAARAAFRQMDRAQHVGKVVIDQRTSAPVTDGAVLITGGTGALGMGLLRHLFVLGNRRFVLMSRQGVDAAAEAEIRALTDQGAQVAISPGDVGSYADVLEAFAASKRAGLRIRAVVHAAGVRGEGPLPELTRARLDEVCRPKIDGLINLQRAWELQGSEPDFVILCASQASLVQPPAGHAADGFANAFLDGWAAALHARGLRTLAVGWGPLDESGMAPSPSASQALQGAGAIPLTQAEVDMAIDHCFAAGYHQVLFTRLDWERQLGLAPGRVSRLFERVLARVPPPAQAALAAAAAPPVGLIPDAAGSAGAAPVSPEALLEPAPTPGTEDSYGAEVHRRSRQSWRELGAEARPVPLDLVGRAAARQRSAHADGEGEGARREGQGALGPGRAPGSEVHVEELPPEIEQYLAGELRHGVPLDALLAALLGATLRRLCALERASLLCRFRSPTDEQRLADDLATLDPVTIDCRVEPSEALASAGAALRRARAVPLPAALELAHWLHGSSLLGPGDRLLGRLLGLLPRPRALAARFPQDRGPLLAALAYRLRRELGLGVDAALRRLGLRRSVAARRLPLELEIIGVPQGEHPAVLPTLDRVAGHLGAPSSRWPGFCFDFSVVPAVLRIRGFGPASARAGLAAAWLETACQAAGLNQPPLLASPACRAEVRS